MARRSMSISRERKLRLSAQIAILDEMVDVEDFKSKEVKKVYLDKKLRLEIRLEEVELLLAEEEHKKERKALSEEKAAARLRPHIRDEGPHIVKVEGEDNINEAKAALEGTVFDEGEGSEKELGIDESLIPVGPESVDLDEVPTSSDVESRESQEEDEGPKAGSGHNR